MVTVINYNFSNNARKTDLFFSSMDDPADSEAPLSNREGRQVLGTQVGGGHPKANNEMTA